jgi:hypothetical protein
MKQITLNIGGEDRVFYFGLGFLGNLLESENLSIDEIGYKCIGNPYKWNTLIMFYSLEYGYIRKGETPNFTKHDVTEWLEDAGGFNSEVFKSWEKAFTQSLTKDVPQEKSKKKATIK